MVEKKNGKNDLIHMRNKSFLLLLCFLLAGCIKEELMREESELKSFNCFSVSFEDSPMTKVHMEDGGSVAWDDWDRIGVFSDIQAPVPYTRGEDGRFYGEMVTGNEFYAFSPFTYGENIDDIYDSDNPTILKFRSDGELVMVAKSSGNELTFKQTCGLLHFRIKCDDAQAVSARIQTNNSPHTYDADWGEYVSGDGQVDVSQNNPVFAITGGNKKNYANELCKYKNDDGYWSIYIPVPEMTFAFGFSLQVYVTFPNLTQDFYQKYTTKEIKITRGQMKSFKAIDISLELDEENSSLEKERDALISIYNALDGDNWTDNSNWCSDKPLGEWAGVIADGYGHVEYLHLIDDRLNGTIPKEIGDLTQLYSLDISSNNIVGDIPESIGRLVNLRSLSLSATGAVPKSFENLKLLEQLTLVGVDVESGKAIDGYEQPSGGIDCISEFKSLSSLHLYQTHGYLGADFSRLNHLRFVWMGTSPGLYGPVPVFGDLSEVYDVYLHMSNFAGSIPTCYATALDSPNLQSIWFYGNRITGELPQEITSHPVFPEWAWAFIQDQQDGYGIEIDKVPASRYVYPTLDGGVFDLGKAYSNADYTMIVRWAEWCENSKTFLPVAMRLANKYSSEGLQTIWAYYGGDETARNAYMSKYGLDQFEPHIQECSTAGFFIHGVDHQVWSDWMGGGSPFVEIVDHDGNIIFVDDRVPYFSQQGFSNSRDNLELFLIDLLGDPEVYYESTDFSADGVCHVLQTATSGAGINVVLMGDAFSDRLIADGTYETAMRQAMNAFFSEEPFKSYKELFNVYYVDVVSPHEVYYKSTALDTYYGAETLVGGDDNAVIDYALNAISSEQIDDAVIIVLMNRDFYAGTCYMYQNYVGDFGRGLSISYFPTSSVIDIFNGVVSHESGGHGFAKLADEYDYSYKGAIPSYEEADYHLLEPYGWWKNVDFTSEPSMVKWATFIEDDRYSTEGIGVFEGACTYSMGAWRPTENSIMRYNTGGFNAPSRYAIWYRIGKLAYGADWAGSYEDFVAYDVVNRQQPTTAARHRSYVEKQLPPLAPPVVVSRDWRDAIK